MNEEELESTNVTCTCKNEANKHKETSITYDNNSKEKTFRNYEKKEKERDGNIIIYECGKTLCHSTYKHTSTATDLTKDIYMSMME